MIDWEEWAVMPYGAGYLLNNREMASGHLEVDWALERWGPPGVTEAAVAVAAAAYRAARAVRHGHIDTLERCLGMIARAGART